MESNIKRAVGQIFKKYDRDSKGSLNVNQLRQVLQDIYSTIKETRAVSQEQAMKAFVSIDKNKNGKIEPEQLQYIIHLLSKQK